MRFFPRLLSVIDPFPISRHFAENSELYGTLNEEMKNKVNEVGWVG